jgi:hypothetical protein
LVAKRHHIAFQLRVVNAVEGTLSENVGKPTFLALTDDLRLLLGECAIYVNTRCERGMGNGVDQPVASAVDKAEAKLSLVGDAVVGAADAKFMTSVAEGKALCGAAAETMIPNWNVGSQDLDDLRARAVDAVCAEAHKDLKKCGQTLKSAALHAEACRSSYNISTESPRELWLWMSLFVSIEAARAMNQLFTALNDFDKDNDTSKLRDTVQREIKSVRKMAQEEVQRNEQEFLPPLLLERCFKVLWSVA